MKAKVEVKAVSALLEPAPSIHSSSQKTKNPSSHGFEDMARLLPVGIFRMDPGGKRTYVNDCWTRIAGLTSAEAAGDGWLRAVHSEDRTRVKAEWEHALSSRSNFRSEYRFENRSGRITWVIGHAVPEFDANGQLIGFLGTITDVTEQKRTERINEDRFRSAFGFAPHGMALVGPGGRFLQVNRFLCQMLGYTETELLNLRFQDISHPDELEASLEGAKALLENRAQVLDLEKRYIAKDGRHVWVHLRSSLVRDSGGEPFYFVSHMQEITDRKHQEEALRQSEERYRQLVEVSKDGILIHSHGRIVFVNPAAAKIFGASSADQLKNIRVLDLVHPGSRAVVEQRIRDLREGSRFQPFIRETLMRLDGTTVDVEAAGVPFVYAGQPAIQVLIRDISETVRAEKERDRLFHEVEAARDRLQMLSQRLVEVQELERRRIARELHDEIGQQLTALRLNLEEDAAAHRLVASEAYKDACARVQKLLTSVRDLSLDLRPTMLDDFGLIPALLWHFDRYSAISHIKVDFKQSGLERRRFGSEVETAAYRIIQEALTNVLRHAGVKEISVRIWISEPVEKLSILVEDRGRGFDVEESFRTGFSSGLAGMRERASLLGGALLVESARGQGTSITAELPVEGKTVRNSRP